MGSKNYYLWVRERLGNGKCPVCGKEFERKTGNHVYCSRACAYIGQRRKKKLETGIVRPTPVKEMSKNMRDL